MYDLAHLRGLGIVQFPDAILKQPSLPVEDFGSETRLLVQRMFDVCRAAPGAGLAAVQLGELKRIFVADISRRRGDFEPIAFINPEIELAGSETVKADEGCLSFPNVWLPVARSAELNVRYFDLEGNRKEARCKELLSLVVQHEYDHLNGISIIDRVSKLRRDVAVRKIKRALQEQSAA